MADDFITEPVLNEIIETIAPQVLDFLRNRGIIIREDNIDIDKELTVDGNICADNQVKASLATFLQTEFSLLQGKNGAIQIKDELKIENDITFTKTVEGPTGCFPDTLLQTLREKELGQGVILDGNLNIDSLQAEDGCIDNLQVPIIQAKDNTITVSSKTDFNGIPIVNYVEPTVESGLATKMNVDFISAGLDPKESCLVSSQVDIDLLSSPALIDGISLPTMSRVLVRNQIDPRENGIYIYFGPGLPMQRSFDQDGTPENEVSAGNHTIVETGTDAGKGFFVLGPNNIDNYLEIGVDPIVWGLFVVDGPQGPTGVQGPQGFMGPQGYTGLQGFIGVQGFQGQTGFMGPQGLQGFQGNMGLVGPRGFQGPQGSQGFQGFQGPEGIFFNQKIVLNDTGNATTNGTNLKTALSGISDNSSSKRYVIFLEPGIYDTGSSTFDFLDMKSYVSIIGCGKKNTTIRTDTVSSTYMNFPAINDVTVANLKIEALTSTDVFYFPGSVNNNIHFKNLLIEHEGIVAEHLATTNNMLFLNCEMIQTGTSGTTTLDLKGTAGTVTVKNCVLRANASSGTCTGISNTSTTLVVKTSQILMEGTGTANVCLSAFGGEQNTIDNSVLIASGAGTDSFVNGINSGSGFVHISGSRLSGAENLTGTYKQVNCHDGSFAALPDV